ncbi:MAG TPA: SurA N-terminal domain-containing protein [Pseudomonadales bacterium]|nr:SurA N-terminal domain-containing protein [Pseudomonadales bacterium]
MLQNIRDKTQGTLAKIILALIVIPFAAFGIDAFFTGGVPEVARVNGEAVTEPELAQNIELERRRLLSQMQDSVDAALLDEARLKGPVLEAMIDRTLLRQVAERSGFRVGEAMLNQLIIDNESFHENGVFSQARFQGLLASNGMSPAQFKDLMREEIMISQVTNGLEVSEFATDVELGNVARLTQQTLNVQYFSVPVEGAGTGVEVPADRIAAYFEENKSEFLTEETLQVEYLELKLADLSQPVAEAEVRAEYERRAASFEGADERHAAHIMLSSLPDEEAQARLAALRERALAGEDFATLARDNSEDAGSTASGGDLGFSSGDAFPAEFETALKSLSPGEVSAPVKSESGWHLVKLLELRQQTAPSFEEMRAGIETELQRRAAEPLFVERSDRLADLTFNSDDLAEASSALGLERKLSPEFGRRGGEGVFADARVIAAAFGEDVLANRQNSERIELDDEHVVVLRLKEHKPARQQELAEVEVRIRDLLRESMVREKVRIEAEQLLAGLDAGRSIEQIAKAAGYELKVVERYGRDAPGIPSELGEALFRTPRGADGSGRGTVVTAGGDALVYRFDNFREGALEKLPAEQREMLGELLQRSRAREVQAHYQQRLRESSSVELL